MRGAHWCADAHDAFGENYIKISSHIRHMGKASTYHECTGVTLARHECRTHYQILEKDVLNTLERCVVGLHVSSKLDQREKHITT